MKVLFVNLPNGYCRAGSRWAHKRSEKGLAYHPFPFFLAYATSVSIQRGVDADIKDCIALGWSKEKFYDYVSEFSPDLLVVETSTPSYYHDLELIKDLNCEKVAVGFHATALPEQCLKDGYDYVVRGEYEFAIHTALKSLKIVKSPLIKDLNSLPYPPWHLMPMEKYNEPICEGRNVSVMSSRGCPFNCSFCNLPVYYGHPNFRTRDTKQVAKEVMLLLNEYDVDEFYFDDNTINASERHLTHLCKEMGKPRKLGVRWVCMGTGKLKPELAKLMAESGCSAYKFGVESSNLEVLKAIPKAITLEDVVKTVKACKKYGIRTHATYVIGLPFDTPERAGRTVDFALHLDTDTMQFSMAVPYPATRFYKMAKHEGWLLTEDWSKYNATTNSPVAYPDFTKDEIEKVYREAWTKWNRYMVLKKPKTVLHHLHGVYKREGICEMLKTVGWGFKRFVRGVKP